MNRKDRRSKNKKNNVNAITFPAGSIITEKNGRTKVSIPVPQSALFKVEDKEQYLSDFAQAQKLVEEDNIADATQVLTKLLKQHPRDFGVLELLGLSSERLKNYQAALKFYGAARELQPDRHVLDVCISNLLIRIDEIEDGIALGEQVIEKHLDALDNHEEASLCAIVGNAYMLLGEKEKAKPLLQKACDLDPDNIEHFFNYLTQPGKIKDASDPYFQRLKFLEETQFFQTEKEKGHLEYTLFDCYDALKEHETAFDHALKGAAYKRSWLNYDKDMLNKIIVGIKAYFNKDFFQQNIDKGCPAETPVFIIGMPRSGTTLLEQILQAHPDISGIGEDALTGHMIKHYSLMKPFQGTPYPLRLSQQIDGYFPPQQIGQKYADYLYQKHPDAKRVINKAIGNMLYVGYLSIALPNCKFIHIKRNAMDSCISAFTKNFTDESQSYTYDLEELGDYYKNYVELLDHWNEVLPGKILNIEYEQIVDNLEGKAREIVDFLELPWNDACLEFHKAKSVVRTASITQVRKPIYKGAINRWKKYGPKIIPLIDALGHAAPAEAIKYAQEHRSKTT